MTLDSNDGAAVDPATPAGSCDDAPLTMHASAYGGWGWFTVVFTGTAADQDRHAASWIKRKGHLAIEHDESLTDRHPLTMDAMYPLCEHQMSLHLCAGPDHYLTREQEMALGL